MQQDNNIKNKLQQLENQQLPDLSHMDEHWQQMQAVLQPQVSPGNKTTINRWTWILGAIILISTTAFLIDHFSTKNENIIQAVSKTVQQNNIVVSPTTIRPPAIIIDSSRIMAKQNTPVQKVIHPKTNITPVNTINLAVKYDSIQNTLKAAQPDKQGMLNSLLNQLAKKEQEFVIDNRRDTLLTGEEGSVLLIPAQSLGGNNKVKISLKEFYKPSEIILNKLSTTSDGQQLITGGMVHITATVNDQPVNIQPNKIRLYMTDTSAEMKKMQLFEGEEKKNNSKIFDSHEFKGEAPGNVDIAATGENSAYINWVPRNQYFKKQVLVTRVRVFDIKNKPYKVEERKKGSIAYFEKADDSKLTRAQLAKMLKHQYGYYKVRVKNSWKIPYNDLDYGYDGYQEEGYGVGDSSWMSPETAKKYNLTPIAVETHWKYENFSATSKVDDLLDYTQTNKQLATAKQDVFGKLKNKYFIDINKLGWINCDHFNNDTTKLVEYAVDLNDSAQNYYTILVFTNLKSMMTGYLSGSKVIFENIPHGLPVKIISIGINKNGNTVMAVKDVITNKNGLSDLPFEDVTTTSIISSLSKMDDK